ncbi:MAG TPA: protein phosphatase 2C domain-containing protein, partial [Polyangiaceae bacterium]|nr:protein phosphatase 2C domain-containing protein [Polyangiaceae bacterium]
MTTDQALDLPAVEYAGRSDPGRDPSKQVNEDAGGHRETRLGHLVVVCDGMGGHASGREAAELALSTIFEMFDQAPDGVQPGAVLRGAIEEASRRVYAMPTTEAGGRPGSTVVGILLHPYGTEVAHVGDSRVYLVHEGQIARVTRDHSIVQEMVDRGLLTLEQAASHPDANRITRALGMAPEVEVELRPVPVHHVTGDAFVLCSDGLSDLVADAEILQTVASEPAAQAVGKLVDLANARGGHDNITVLVLRP